jgi:hypothetical protein
VLFVNSMNVVAFLMSRRVECWCFVARQLAIQRHVSSTLDLQAREYVSVNVNFYYFIVLGIDGVHPVCILSSCRWAVVRLTLLVVSMVREFCLPMYAPVYRILARPVCV